MEHWNSFSLIYVINARQYMAKVKVIFNQRLATLIFLNVMGILSKVWNKHLTPKVNMFLWLAVRNRVSKGDNLWRRGFLMPSKFLLCECVEETLDHLVLLFPFAREIWERLYQKLRCAWVFPCTLNALIYQWVPPW